MVWKWAVWTDFFEGICAACRAGNFDAGAKHVPELMEMTLTGTPPPPLFITLHFPSQ